MPKARSAALFLVLVAMVWMVTGAPVVQEAIPEAADARSLILPQSVNLLSFPALSAMMKSFFSLLVAGLSR